MVKADITKQEPLKGKESLLNWMDFLPKRDNLSTEALIPPMPVAHLLNETRYTLGSSALFRIQQACSNKSSSEGRSIF